MYLLLLWVTFQHHLRLSSIQILYKVSMLVARLFNMNRYRVMHAINLFQNSLLIRFKVLPNSKSRIIAAGAK